MVIKDPSENQLHKETWLASFPEYNPNPSLEISFEGQIAYTNPASRKLFPTILEQQCDHPYLAGWEEVVALIRRQPELVIEREIRVGEEYFQQSIHFLKEYQRLRVYGMKITERKRLEGELQESEKKYRELVKYAPAGIYEVDFRTQKFLSVNEAMCLDTGYSREELMEKGPMELLDKPSQQLFRQRIQKWLAGEPPERNVEFRVLAKDGHEILTELDVTFTKDEQGRPQGATVIAHNITKRKQAEQKLEQEKARLQCVINNIPDEIWFVDTSGNVAMVNEQVVQEFGPGILGEQAARDIARNLEIYHLDGTPRPPEEAPLLRALEGEHLRDLEEIIRTPASGEPRFRQVNAVPVNDEEGRLLGSVCIVRDITERKQAEEALRVSEERFRTVFERAEIGIAIGDLEGRVIGSNPALERILGYTQPELHLKAFTEFTHPEDAKKESSLVQELLSDQRDHYEIEKRFIRKDGQEILVRLIGGLVKTQQGEPQFGIALIEDITERKRAEEALRESERRERLRAAQLDAVLEALPVGMAITDRQGANLLSNTTFERIWGSSRPQVNSINDYQKYKAWWIENGKEVAPDEWASIQAVEKGLPIIGQMLEIQRYNGSHIFVINSAAPVHDAGGKIIGSAVAVQDITRLREAEQELAEANARLEQLVHERTVELEHSTVELEHSTQELQVAYEELKITNEELEAANQQLITNNRQTEALAEISQFLVQAGPDIMQVMQGAVQKISKFMGDACTLRLVSEDGEWLNPVAFFDPDPEAYQILESILKQKRDRVEDDFYGEVYRTGVSKIFQVKLTADWAKDLQTKFSPYFMKYQATCAAIVPLRLNNRILGTLGITRRSPGKAYTQDELLFLQELADRVSLAIYNSKLYQELEKSLINEKLIRKQLIQSEKYAALARLVGSVAHELNNPLQTIQNCLYLLKNDLTADEAAETIEMAISEGKRMGHLAEQLKETYRPSKDTQPTYFDVLEILEKVHVLLSPKLNQNGIDWIVESNQDSILVHGIPDQLKQVFMNICLNAIEAIGEKRGQICVGVSLPKSNHRVCIAIQDTGPGIAKKDLPRIFEPFYTTKVKGTGLGLAICYEIIKDYEGEIRAESEPGQGATFKIFIPVKEGER